MENIFRKESHANFTWEKLGDIAKGRPNLGEDVPVKVYRVFEYAMYDVLCHRLGQDEANEIIRSAGYHAGKEFAKHVLDIQLSMEEFLADTAKKLLLLKIGVLRIEKMDRTTGSFVLTVAEDLDCSGLPVTGEVVCNYDEGFLQGIFETYTQKHYEVREIDCWASGDKVCRFSGRIQKDAQER